MFGLSYGAQQLGFSRNAMLVLVLLSMVLALAALPYFGRMSDRFGRRPVFLGGVIAMGVLVFPWFWLLNAGSFVLALIGYLAITCGFAASFGPLAAFFAESFETKVRYSGISFGYTLGTLASSAVAPIIAAWLLENTGHYSAVGWYMIAMIVLSAACTLLLPETYGQDRLEESRCAADPEQANTEA